MLSRKRQSSARDETHVDPRDPKRPSNEVETAKRVLFDHAKKWPNAIKMLLEHYRLQDREVKNIEGVQFLLETMNGSAKLYNQHSFWRVVGNMVRKVVSS